MRRALRGCRWPRWPQSASARWPRCGAPTSVASIFPWRGWRRISTDSGSCRSAICTSVRRCGSHTKALAMFNNGEGGFKDRDLYPFCFHSRNGTVAETPVKKLVGTDVRALKDNTGKPCGEEFDRARQKDMLPVVAYLFPSNGADTQPV